jgi:hypothetical protein
MDAAARATWPPISRGTGFIGRWQSRNSAYGRAFLGKFSYPWAMIDWSVSRIIFRSDPLLIDSSLNAFHPQLRYV